VLFNKKSDALYMNNPVDFETCVTEIFTRFAKGDLSNLDEILRQDIKFNLLNFQTRLNVYIEQNKIYNYKKGNFATEIETFSFVPITRDNINKLCNFFKWLCGWRMEDYGEMVANRLRVLYREMITLNMMNTNKKEQEKRVIFAAEGFSRAVHMYAK